MRLISLSATGGVFLGVLFGGIAFASKRVYALCFFVIICGSSFAGEYTRDWLEFEKELEKSYPFFKIKGIDDDWRRAKPDLRKKVEECSDDAAFMVVVDQAIRLIRDGHAGIFHSRAGKMMELLPQTGLPLVFRPARGNRVVVVSAAGALSNVVVPGTVVEKINGVDARRFMEEKAKESWEEGGYFSSPQRAAFLNYRMPLRSGEVTSFKLSFRIGDKLEEMTVRNDFSGRLPIYNFPRNMQKLAGACACAILPGGAGYLYLRRIMGDETASGIEAALEKYPDVPGWVVDLRGNGGGGYSDLLKEAMKRLVSKKTAVIIDAGCFSAGETFARDLKQVSNNKAVLFGSRTAGSSSTKKVWAFPSGVASVRFSVASRKGFRGQPIEFNGIDPDVAVESAPEDLHKGLDSEIVEAEKFVLGARR